MSAEQKASSKEEYIEIKRFMSEADDEAAGYINRSGKASIEDIALVLRCSLDVATSVFLRLQTLGLIQAARKRT